MFFDNYDAMDGPTCPRNLSHSRGKISTKKTDPTRYRNRAREVIGSMLPILNLNKLQKFVALAQTVTCVTLVQRVRCLIPGDVKVLL